MSQYALMPYSDYENACDAIRSKTGSNSLITSDLLASEISSMQGGTSVSDGIVVTARDSNGYATEAELYHNGTIYPYQFWQGYKASSWTLATDGIWKELSTLTVKGKPKNLKAFCLSNLFNADIVGDFSEVVYIDGDESTSKTGTTGIFNSSAIESISLDSLSYLCGSTFVNCKALRNVFCPKVINVWSKWDAGASRATFGNCTALESVQIGSASYGVAFLSNQAFLGCSQNGLTITVYTNGAYADTALANARNGAINATIIIKASEDTSYSGASYAAGNTLISSEVSE